MTSLKMIFFLGGGFIFLIMAVVWLDSSIGGSSVIKIGRRLIELAETLSGLSSLAEGFFKRLNKVFKKS